MALDKRRGRHSIRNQHQVTVASPDFTENGGWVGGSLPPVVLSV